MGRRNAGPVRRAGSERTHVFLDQSYPAVVGNSWVVLKADGNDRVVPRSRTRPMCRRPTSRSSAKVTRLQLNTAYRPVRFRHPRDDGLRAKRRAAACSDADRRAGVGQRHRARRVGRRTVRRQMLIICGRTASDARRPRVRDGQRSSRVSSTRSSSAVAPASRSRRSTTPTSRHTVTIYGNVALATHGETVEEVLGSGDASQAAPAIRAAATAPHLYQSRQSERRGVNPRGAGERRALARESDTRRHEVRTTTCS